MTGSHFICPGCGAEIRVGSSGCPKCTREPKKKWKPTPDPWEREDLEDGLDLGLPEDDTFDYDQFVADEFGGPQKRSAREWVWWVTGVILLAALLFLWVL